MSVWHYVVGIGVGVLATIITVIASRRSILPQSPKSEYFSPTDERCTICLENMTNDNMAYVGCGHAFHEQCLRSLRKHKQNCPTCRAKI